jgi:alkylation response protein AidB-like acyl-CoA dehydrogenase
MDLAQAPFETLLDELDFQLHQVLGLPDRDDHLPLIEAAIALAAAEFAPHAAALDACEPTFDGERVHLPPTVATALQAYIDAGFLAAPFPEADGGLGLPYAISQAMVAAFHAADPSTAAYPFLTAAAANLLRAFGTEDQKQRLMAPMLEGRFFGTMALSEPQAGSSLGDLRTRAVPQDDGSTHIIGDKMWISGGEHELSETIVHLVLARLPDAPPGVKGISLFAVTRHHLDEAGDPGERNGVSLIGLNHKMGYRGTVNTALAFGAEAPAVGELVGEPHQGLKAMFHMMNEARIGVGLGATMIGWAGYRTSLAYARDRRQGRHPDERDPTSPPVPILEHADVRRMLLTQKVLVEGGLALSLFCATLVDDLERGDAAAKTRAEGLLGILTPIAKAWPSEHGPRANDLAIQVLGGAGYARDYPVERYYRDNRLNPIHEGTNGVQGMDLLGRKVLRDGGQGLRLLLGELGGSVARHRGPADLDELCDGLDAAVALVAEVSGVLGMAAAKGQVRLCLANATEYLHMVGHVVIGWMWLEQAAAALRPGDGDPLRASELRAGKLHAARFFARVELPRIERQAALLRRLDDTAMTMPDGGF